MLILLKGTSGQESAVDVFDVGSIFPAAQKGEGPNAIPVLGVSILKLKNGEPIVVAEGVESLMNRVNEVRERTARLAAGEDLAPAKRLL